MGDKELDECLFCKIYKERIDVIYEAKYWYARFDKFPKTPGHVEIIPKRHVVSLLDLDLRAPEWTELYHIIPAVIKLINKTDLKEVYRRFLKNPIKESSRQMCEQMLTHVGIDKKMDGCIWGVNEGEAAGRTIHHLHIHIMPRYWGDEDNPRGGIRKAIPGGGDY
ncbi:HIT family protein [Patescibacteria group bacterium AH-259-L05]|nr:HIT family protein [Patescibacteria group bacterium AH-259-L05]